MKYSLLVLTSLTLLATGCSHKDDGRRQGQGAPGFRRDGQQDRRDDRWHGRRFGPRREVRLRPHGPLTSSIRCLDQSGNAQDIWINQLPEGSSELVAGSQFALGEQSVQVLSRSFLRNSPFVILNVQDMSSGDMFQTRCQTY